jgi:hypothetical protein
VIVWCAASTPAPPGSGFVATTFPGWWPTDGATPTQTVAIGGVHHQHTAEGKTPKEIRRCLKRYIARELYRTLTATITPTDHPGVAS